MCRYVCLCGAVRFSGLFFNSLYGLFWVYKYNRKCICIVGGWTFVGVLYVILQVEQAGCLGDWLRAVHCCFGGVIDSVCVSPETCSSAYCFHSSGSGSILSVGGVWSCRADVGGTSDCSISVGGVNFVN